MMCVYCGIANDSGSSRCAGCGAHGMAASVAPAAPTTSLYEQIGRAVVDREHGNALQTLARLGEREEASKRETGFMRVVKVMICLFVFWQFPALLFAALGFGLMFLFWIYLPYRMIKAVLSWVAS